MDCSAGAKSGRWPARGAALVWPFLALTCSACTVVEVHSGDGQVHIERHLGFVSLELPPDAPSRVVHLTGVGLVSLGSDTTLGYADATLVALGYDCRLLVWMDNPDQIDHLRRLVGTTDDICIAGSE